MEVILTEELTEKQDDLSGDVQELIEIQTQEGVIKKLEEMESIMVEATLNLLEGKTDGETLAIQTEIIEKAYEAAKEKQKSKSSQSDTDKALMDMLKKMMGVDEKESKGAPDPNKKQEGNKAGEGQKGDGSPKASEEAAQNSSELPLGSRRTVPSAAPTTGELLPSEFQDLIDEYNQQ